MHYLHSMLTNYLRSAMRNFRRDKVNTFIHITGLAIGLATCMIIGLYIYSELSYDRFYDKADRIVRVNFKGSVNQGTMDEANVMPPVARTMVKDYPEVQAATRITRGPKLIIKYQDKTFEEYGFVGVDSNFFQVFSLHMLEGSPSYALKEPGKVVITQEMARKYFGKEDPLGKPLHITSWKRDFTVSGVIEDIPQESHFHFDFFAALDTGGDQASNSWMTSGYYTYLLLQPGYDYKQLDAKLPQVVDKYMGPQLLQSMGMTLAEFRRRGNNIGLYLQKLTDIHLHSTCTNDIEAGGDIRYIYMSGAIGAFMLLIACINFINLSTAGASRRAKEVGVRKVLGSGKSALIRQFLTESVLLAFVSLILALGLVILVLPGFNQLAGKHLTLLFMGKGWFIAALLMFGLLTGVLAGLYPAFFLSSFKPVTVLKGNFRRGGRSLNLRSGLVVFQFFISILLIVCTTVIYQQLHYISHKKLGYDKSQVMILPETWILGNKADIFKQRISEDSRVASVSLSDYLPAGPSGDNNFFITPEMNKQQMVKSLRYDVDYNYISTLGMEMSAGRNFQQGYATDSMGVIINETAARVMGLEKNPIGQVITNTDNDHHTYRFHVIGVVKDFHFRSMHELITPLVMVLSTNPGTMIIKIKTKDVGGLVADMTKWWNSLTGDAPLAYSFLDDRFNNTYASEQKTEWILGLFSGLTILVACLGLFGLVTFTAEQRRKEIGIRKVLGASVSGIVTLLSKDFLKLVAIAFILAVPLGWYLMHRWLQDYEYRIGLGAGVFIFAAIVAIALTLLTVGGKSVRAALANPVSSLRSE